MMFLSTSIPGPYCESQGSPKIWNQMVTIAKQIEEWSMNLFPASDHRCGQLFSELSANVKG